MVSTAHAQMERVFSNEEAISTAVSWKNLLRSYFLRERIAEMLQITHPSSVHVDGVFVGCWNCNDALVRAEKRAPWEVWFTPFLAKGSTRAVVEIVSLDTLSQDTAVLRFENGMPVFIAEGYHSNQVEYLDGRIASIEKSHNPVPLVHRYQWFKDTVKVRCNCMDLKQSDSEFGVYVMNPNGWNGKIMGGTSQELLLSCLVEGDSTYCFTEVAVAPENGRVYMTNITRRGDTFMYSYSFSRASVNYYQCFMVLKRINDEWVGTCYEIDGRYGPVYHSIVISR